MREPKQLCARPIVFCSYSVWIRVSSSSICATCCSALNAARTALTALWVTPSGPAHVVSVRERAGELERYKATRRRRSVGRSVRPISPPEKRKRKRQRERKTARAPRRHARALSCQSWSEGGESGPTVPNRPPSYLATHDPMPILPMAIEQSPQPSFDVRISLPGAPPPLS